MHIAIREPSAIQLLKVGQNNDDGFSIESGARAVSHPLSFNFHYSNVSIRMLYNDLYGLGCGWG